MECAVELGGKQLAAFAERLGGCVWCGTVRLGREGASRQSHVKSTTDLQYAAWHQQPFERKEMATHRHTHTQGQGTHTGARCFAAGRRLASPPAKNVNTVVNWLGKHHRGWSQCISNHWITFTQGLHAIFAKGSMKAFVYWFPNRFARPFRKTLIQGLALQKWLTFLPIFTSYSITDAKFSFCLLMDIKRKSLEWKLFSHKMDT